MIEPPARWYCLSSSGIATLCANEIDARKEAVLDNQNWPTGAPHRAVQLVDFAELAAERERCFYWCSLGDHDGYTTHHIQAGTPVPDNTA